MPTDVDFKFLCSIIGNGSITNVNWAAVAKECGYTNVQSARNRYTVLKKKAESSGGASAPSTPKKRKAGADEEVKTPGKRGRKQKNGAVKEEVGKSFEKNGKGKNGTIGVKKEEGVGTSMSSASASASDE